MMLEKTAAEFFAGIGLVRMGLERAGWSVVFANDLCEEKREMYEAQFGVCDELITADVHRLAADEIPSVTLATASFPCTDLSLAGGRRGLNNGESSAFWGFHALLQGMRDRRPPLVLLENVTGFLSSHGGTDFLTAMKALNELGYTVDPFVLDARWFTPQSRPRLFVVASQAGDADSINIADLEASRIRPAAVVSFVREHPDLEWRIRRLPDPPLQCEKRLEDILDDLPDDAGAWWSRERAEYLYNQMSPRHREIADRMVAGERWSCGAVFRRIRKGRSMAELRTDGLAGCLRTPKGGSGRQILFQAGYGKYKARLFTPSECARLMGADGYRITVPLNQALFGFGDAVCVPAIEWIARHYLNPLIGDGSQSSAAGAWKRRSAEAKMHLRQASS
jgi:DNA (cytosine-5)-methyltransferase 1